MITTKEDIEQDAWNLFVTSFPEANFLHSYEWGEFHVARGKKIIRLAFYEDEKMIAAVTGQIEDARRGRYLAIAGGPIMDWSSKALADEVFKVVRSVGSKLGCVFVRMRPQLEANRPEVQLFKEAGYKEAPMPLSVEHAGVLDVRKSDDEIIADMSQSLRRKIRKAQKQDITISVSESEADLETFYGIHADHAQRQAYVAFTKEFLFKQFAAFKASNQVKIYTAEHDGHVIAQNFIIFYGQEASYHYGVSTSEGVKLSSAPLLHLRAIQDAREIGVTRYNFWGIVDEDDTNHRYYGVSQFKRSFGVSEIKHLPAQDLVLKKLAYKKNWIIETTRKKIRKL